MLVHSCNFTLQLGIQNIFIVALVLQMFGPVVVFIFNLRFNLKSNFLYI